MPYKEQSISFYRESPPTPPAMRPGVVGHLRLVKVVAWYTNVVAGKIL